MQRVWEDQGKRNMSEENEFVLIWQLVYFNINEDFASTCTIKPVWNSHSNGHGFQPHWRHCVVSLSNNIYPSLVLVQPRNTHLYITERLLMGRKESNQTNNQMATQKYIDKTKILMTNGSLMKVESIAEFSTWSILQYFWPALSYNWSWNPIFGLFKSGRFTQKWAFYTGFTVLLHDNSPLIGATLV